MASISFGLHIDTFLGILFDHQQFIKDLTMTVMLVRPTRQAKTISLTKPLYFKTAFLSFRKKFKISLLHALPQNESSCTVIPEGVHAASQNENNSSCSESLNVTRPPAGSPWEDHKPYHRKDLCGTSVALMEIKTLC